MVYEPSEGRLAHHVAVLQVSWGRNPGASMALGLPSLSHFPFSWYSLLPS